MRDKRFSHLHYLWYKSVKVVFSLFSNWNVGNHACSQCDFTKHAVLYHACFIFELQQHTFFCGNLLFRTLHCATQFKVTKAKNKKSQVHLAKYHYPVFSSAPEVVCSISGPEKLHTKNVLLTTTQVDTCICIIASCLIDHRRNLWFNFGFGEEQRVFYIFLPLPVTAGAVSNQKPSHSFHLLHNEKSKLERCVWLPHIIPLCVLRRWYIGTQTLVSICTSSVKFIRKGCSSCCYQVKWAI